jgi:hypothetical protein
VPNRNPKRPNKLLKKFQQNRPKKTKKNQKKWLSNMETVESATKTRLLNSLAVITLFATSAKESSSVVLPAKTSAPSVVLLL